MLGTLQTTQAVVRDVTQARPIARYDFGQWSRRAAVQLLYITPIFWFNELAQNWVFRLATGTFGWGYPSTPDPRGPLDWYSLWSLPAWALTVVAFSALQFFFFERAREGEAHRVPFWAQVTIAGAVGWGGEWATGYLSTTVLHHYLQVWPSSPLVFVSLSALPFWLVDYMLFHHLTSELRSAQAYRAAAGV